MLNVPEGSYVVWNENSSLYKYDLTEFEVREKVEIRYRNVESEYRGEEPLRSKTLLGMNGTMLRGQVRFSFDMYWMDMKKSMVFLNYPKCRVQIRCNGGTVMVEYS